MRDSHVTWMVFASLLVVGVSTLDSSASARPRWRRSRSSDVYGSLFAILFCITAVVDGGPATLMTLVIVAAVIQLIISKWLFILRRIVRPTVGGTIMMILSITLASVVFSLLDEASKIDPEEAPLTALATMVIVAALMLRGSAALRLWGPLIGIVGGSIVADGIGNLRVR